MLRKTSVRIILFLMLLTVVFIFAHSAMSPEVSESESNVVGGIVEEIVEQIAPNNESLRDFIKNNIRKIAHFAEFGLLGLECAILGLVLLLELKSRSDCAKLREDICLSNSFCSSLGIASILKAPAYSFIFGLLVAFADESVQILSKRGPSVKDIWIDLLGFASFYIAFSICAVLTYAIAICKKKRKAKKISGVHNKGSNI